MKNTPLFSPFEIRNVLLTNRIVMPALASFLIEDDGTITEKTVEHYRRRAAGGPGMVIVEACAVSPEGVVSAHQARIYHDRFMEGLSRIARAMKAEGAVPAVQIHHGGRQTSARVIGRKPLAPSPLPCPSIRGEVEPLTEEGIRDLIEKFGDAAERAAAAGFELIEIHGAHGYLINQFLSAFSNIREDGYGGDISGRTRFAREIVEEIRGRLGPEYPISFKISAQEFVPGGLTVKESIEILRILVEAGIDVVQVSAGNDATPEWISQPMFMKKACLADSAGEVKRALDIPVMAVGRINHPLVADHIIRDGLADLVCVGRGLLADPEMPVKAREGRLEEIRTCLACNTCMESIFRKGRVECLVNPALGREHEMAYRPAAEKKKVMVIGGGPAGMDVAWVAAWRGHEVHLFEKTGELGGQLLLGAMTSYKREFRNLIEYLKRQVDKHGVHCHLNREVRASTVVDMDPDVVILAAGSIPVFPDLEGLESRLVVSVPEALNGEGVEGRSVVVIGGGPTGCEVAHHLAEGGASVTLVEMRARIGIGIETVTRKVLMKSLEKHSVRMMTQCKPKLITESGVIVVSEEGEERFLSAHRVVMATGTRADDTLYDEIRALGYTVHRIGDCREPRNAKDAIYEAAVLGRSL